MVVGIDVNHPSDNFQVTGDSVAAIVASMDGSMGQYATYVASCDSRVEPVDTLKEGFYQLLERFKLKNGVLPDKIIVYRDGVADNQFDGVLEKELPALKDALELHGNVDTIEISIIVCQKRHNTRLFFKEEGGQEYLNPCVGLCVDGRTATKDHKGGDVQAAKRAKGDGAGESIASTKYNDFYLNSHLAVLGTSKPCKYTLIYDEIGFKLNELQLLTHWTTHLYTRCTRAVSYATPAYYAHWAARRGKALISAGATREELAAMSKNWLTDPNSNAMYFI